MNENLTPEENETLEQAMKIIFPAIPPAVKPIDAPEQTVITAESNIIDRILKQILTF